MKNRIFNNWILKLTSVVCAALLWIFIYSVNDPAATKTLYNVPVTFLNTEVVTDKNQVYDILDGTDVVRRVTLHSTRSVIDDLDESDISVEADFSKMKLDGTIELRMYSNRHNDSITFKASSEEMKVSVENRKSRNLSLEIRLTGEPKEGYIVGSSRLTQNRISVSGAESLVNSIVSAVAVVDIEETAEDVNTYADIILLDEAGKEISKDKLDVSMKTVSSTVEILATKTVPVIYELSGEAAEGFFATGEANSEVTELLIAGKESTLAKVSEITVAGEELSVAEASEDVIRVVDLDDYLPAGIIRVDSQDNGQAEVTMPIVPIVDREYTIRMGQVQVINVPEGYTVEHVLTSAEMIVVVRGPEHLLETLSIADIKGTIDIAAWMEANEKVRFKDDEILLITAEYDIAENIEVTASTPIEMIAKIVED